MTDRRAALATLRALVALPRHAQRAALDAFRATLHDPPTPEAWNTAFGPGSLYAAWAKTPWMQRLYLANRDAVHAALARARARHGAAGWTALEVGGGDGSLWREALRDDDVGTLYVVDPHPDPAERIRSIAAAAAPQVRVVALQKRLEVASLPSADVAVASLVLHHIAGRDASARQAVGLEGPGKLEALVALRAALAPNGGRLVVNEADVHCDIELAPGDALLADRLIDSYVRRCAMLLADAIEREPADADLRDRWWTILRRWCLDQVDQADVVIEDRDVYELDTPRWEALLRDAGFRVLRRQFTDEAGLFAQILATPA
ncbi:MAG: hypothetical protein RLZZ383_1835 [Pseudomonadota bacterium]|jgi:hypothetical protein